MENFKVAVLLIALSIACADIQIRAKVEISDDLFNKCFPHTKMSEVNAPACFDKNGPLVKSLDLVKECNLRQRNVFRSNQPRKFNISIDPQDLDSYPPNITYSVYSMKINSSYKGDLFWGQMSEPLEPVEDCRDMTLSKICLLPKYDKERMLVVIIPQATKRSDRPWYYEWTVLEQLVLLDTCEVGKPVRETCFNFTNGRIYIVHPTFQPLASRPRPERADYCFFPAPGNISNLVLHNDTRKFKRSVHFPDLKEGKDCKTVKGVKNEEIRADYELVALHTDISTEGAICYQYRVNTLNPREWQNDVRCFPGEWAKTACDYRKDVYFYATLGVVVCLVAIFMFMAGYCFRRYVVKKIERSIPSTFIVAKTTYINEKAPHDDSSAKEEAFPIEVYFPMEGLSDENEDFPAKLDSIEKNEIWSSDDVSMSLAEDGIYCKKFDMVARQVHIPTRAYTLPTDEVLYHSTPT